MNYLKRRLSLWWSHKRNRVLFIAFIFLAFIGAGLFASQQSWSPFGSFARFLAKPEQRGAFITEAATFDRTLANLKEMRFNTVYIDSEMGSVRQYIRQANAKQITPYISFDLSHAPDSWQENNNLAEQLQALPNGVIRDGYIQQAHYDMNLKANREYIVEQISQYRDTAIRGVYLGLSLEPPSFIESYTEASMSEFIRQNTSKGFTESIARGHRFPAFAVYRGKGFTQATTGTVLATFSDNTPAIITNAAGTGQTLVLNWQASRMEVSATSRLLKKLIAVAKAREIVILSTRDLSTANRQQVEVFARQTEIAVNHKTPAQITKKTAGIMILFGNKSFSPPDYAAIQAYVQRGNWLVVIPTSDLNPNDQLAALIGVQNNLTLPDSSDLRLITLTNAGKMHQALQSVVGNHQLTLEQAKEYVKAWQNYYLQGYTDLFKALNTTLQKIEPKWLIATEASSRHTTWRSWLTSKYVDFVIHNNEFSNQAKRSEFLSMVKSNGFTQQVYVRIPKGEDAPVLDTIRIGRENDLRGFIFTDINAIPDSVTSSVAKNYFTDVVASYYPGLVVTTSTPTPTIPSPTPSIPMAGNGSAIVNCAAKPDFAGIWTIWGTASKTADRPWYKGAVITIDWAELEPSNGNYDWSFLESKLRKATDQGLYAMPMIYTGSKAPSWLYENGVPKEVTSCEQGTCTFPYYLDPEYKSFYKRMIESVAARLQNGMNTTIRNKIIGFQCPVGASGDPHPYKMSSNDQVSGSQSTWGSAETAITHQQWIEFQKETFGYYYNAFSKLNPSMRCLFNAAYDPSLVTYVNQQLPGSWLKLARVGDRYDVNNENNPANENFTISQLAAKPASDGSYFRTRSEMDLNNKGWFTEAPLWNMYWTELHALHANLDMHNLVATDVAKPEYYSSYQFFNKYAGSRDPAYSTGVWIALRDGLDAADTNRFPVSTYGDPNVGGQGRNLSRYQKIATAFATYGVKQTDLQKTRDTNYDALADVGYNISPGNYSFGMSQIDPNGTSQGMWRVGSKEQMFGRFARRFDYRAGKNQMYFNIADSFFKSKPLNGAYPLRVRVVYYDQGTGIWSLRYDDIDNTQKIAARVTKTNTNSWKEITVTIADGYMGNRLPNNSDLMLVNDDVEDDTFHMLEVTRTEGMNSCN